MRTRAYRFSGGNPAFPAQWLYGLCRALPGERIRLVTVAAGLMADRPVGPISPPTAWHQQRVSGPHGFAVRTTPFVLRAVNRSRIGIRPAITLRADAAASTASHPASVTIAKRPSLGWDAPGYKDDLPDRQSGLFLRNGLDSPNSIERLIKFRCSERPPHGPRYTTDDVPSASSRHCVSALGRLYPRLGDRDSAAWIACQMREGVAGMSRCRTPSRVSAFITAFMIVAGAAIAPA
jgi:hypothetical protein